MTVATCVHCPVVAFGLKRKAVFTLVVPLIPPATSTLPLVDPFDDGPSKVAV
jgi:hypothetical protein